MSRISSRATPLLILLLLAYPSVTAADCAAANCTDCDQNARNLASCTTVHYSASCSCSVDVNYPEFCILEGDCTYSPGGGGGGIGGTGGGGGGGGCTRTPGEWCPTDCASCTTVFWY